MRIHRFAARVLLVAALAAASLVSIGAPASAVTTSPDAMTTYSARVVVLVNRQRAAVRLPALRGSACATSFAKSWSTRMAATRVFKHQLLTPLLTTCRARQAGENIAYGGRTPEQVIAMWMASPGHRANILRPSFTHIGVGAAVGRDGVIYATQDFLTL